MTWEEEVAKIVEASAVQFVDPAFIAAIRKQENGSPGNEFGVLSLDAGSFDEQLRVAVNSVRNRIVLFPENPLVISVGPDKIRRVRYSDDFIGYFGARWAPIGARNDPRGLNVGWVKGVKWFYAKFLKEGLGA